MINRYFYDVVIKIKFVIACKFPFLYDIETVEAINIIYSIQNQTSTK